VYGLTHFLYHCFKYFGTQANAASGIMGDMVEPDDTHRVETAHLSSKKRIWQVPEPQKGRQF
jgi:hypothetical protein